MKNTIRRKSAQGRFETRPEPESKKTSDIKVTKNSAPLFLPGRISNKQKRILLEENYLFKVARKSKELMINQGKIKRAKKGVDIVRQGEPGESMFLILRGTVSIWIQNRLVAERKEGTFIGEPCVLSPNRSRNATVKAETDCILFELGYETMTAVFKNCHEVLRQIAVVLSERLTERAKFLKQPNEKPILFVGSSSESLPIVQSIFKNEKLKQVADIRPWTTIFSLSEYTIDSLLEESAKEDFALLVLSGDDCVLSRGHKQKAPRDNVVFEAGLFMGAIGRKRTVLLVPDGIELKNLRLPSDFDGITRLRYKRSRNDCILLSRPIEKLIQHIQTNKTR